MTQINLGNALMTLGERESGTARLEEAVAAYRAALRRTNARAGSARLGDDAEQSRQCARDARRAGERDGAARGGGRGLSRGAEERTRERVPLDWAMTQNNLGNALATLGERESGTARLEEAVRPIGLALEERTRQRVPLQWATTQNNLGDALATLGERESSTTRLEEAVGLSRGAGGADARAGSARMGDDAEQSRRCAAKARRAGERNGAARGGSRGMERVPGSHKNCLAARTGSRDRSPPGRDAGRDRAQVREIECPLQQHAFRWSRRQPSCHSRASGNLTVWAKPCWMPAFAGMTNHCVSGLPAPLESGAQDRPILGGALPHAPET